MIESACFPRGPCCPRLSSGLFPKFLHTCGIYSHKQITLCGRRLSTIFLLKINPKIPKCLCSQSTFISNWLLNFSRILVRNICNDNQLFVNLDVRGQFFSVSQFAILKCYMCCTKKSIPRPSNRGLWPIIEKPCSAEFHSSEKGDVDYQPVNEIS